MCLLTISYRIWYFHLVNTGEPLLRCIKPTHWWHILTVNKCFIEFSWSDYFCAPHVISSVSFFRCNPFNHCHVLSVLTFCVSFLRNLLTCPWLVFPSFKHFLNASGSSTSDNPFSPATYFNIHSSLSLRYLSKLCTSTFLFFATYKPSSSFSSCKIHSTNIPLRCRLQFMVINFLVLIPILFNSSFVQSNTPAPYLIIPTAHAFIPAITFPLFNCYLSNFSTLLMNSLFSFSSISLFKIEFNGNLPKYFFLQIQPLSYAFRVVIEFSLFKPSFPSSRPALLTCPDQIPYQHQQKNSSRSG